EHGVNSSINRIREALGDTAGNPRFIETLARRGYRFVAPVECIGPGEKPSPLHSSPSQSPDQSSASNQSAAKSSRRILSSPQDLPLTSYSVVQTLFVLLQLMYLGFYVGALANLAEIEDLFLALPRSTLAL